MVETIATVGSVSTKSTSKGDLFLVQAEGGPYITWKQDIADQARGLHGTVAHIRFTEKPARDPQYPPDRYLDGILPSATPPPIVGNGTATTSGSVTMNVPATGREAIINRGVGVKVAATLLSTFPAEEQTLNTLFRLADTVAAYVATGNYTDSTPTQAILGQTTTDDFPF